MDRSAAARYSLLALAVFMLGVLAAMILSVESHADPPVALEFGPVVFLLLCGLHSWYFRRELEPIRRGWVGGRPRSLRDPLVAPLVLFAAGVALLTLWATFFAMP